MLLQDFYTVQQVDTLSQGKYKVGIYLNDKHPIFKGHFPGNPVTPGVCMLQIIKEQVQLITGTKLILKSAANVKFMALINPERTPDLRLELDIVAFDDEVKIKNTTYFDATVALKLSCIYKKV